MHSGYHRDVELATPVLSNVSRSTRALASKTLAQAPPTRRAERRPRHAMNARRWRRLVSIAEAETQATLAGLPPALRERAADLPVVFEPWVSDDLVESGLDPEILGLFVGDAHDIAASDLPLPPQIFLFLESIWDLAEGDEEAFREEVRTTYLHELGHYLGLDEGDLEDRGLE
jgi:predicted Zn-dependent protease with MMP-like domain